MSEKIDHHPRIGRGYCPKHGYYVLSMRGCSVCWAEAHPRNADTEHILKKIRDKHRRRTT